MNYLSAYQLFLALPIGSYNETMLNKYEIYYTRIILFPKVNIRVINLLFGIKLSVSFIVVMKAILLFNYPRIYFDYLNPPRKSTVNKRQQHYCMLFETTLHIGHIPSRKRKFNNWCSIKDRVPVTNMTFQPNNKMIQKHTRWQQN